MAIADTQQLGEDPRFGHVLATEITPRIPGLEDRRHALAGAEWRDAVLLLVGAAVAAAHLGVRGAEELVPFIVLAALVGGFWLHARRRRIWHAAMIEAKGAARLVVRDVSPRSGSGRHAASWLHPSCPSGGHARRGLATHSMFA